MNCLPSMIKPMLIVVSICLLLTACSSTTRVTTNSGAVRSEPLPNHATDDRSNGAKNHTRSTQPHGGNYTCISAHTFAGLVVGDGHCVSLIKRCSGAPTTQHWRAGKRVMSHKSGSIKPGSIIATFKFGRYPNQSGYHAAIYISHDENGIWVWDQWIGKPVHKRLISARKDGTTASNSAQAYRLVI